MKSIILYPESARYVLKRIFKIYNSQNLKADACSVDPNWEIDYLISLSGILDNYSHLFIILSKNNFDDHWLINILGYIRGSKKQVFFYFTENDNSLYKIFLKYPCGHNYDDVMGYAKEEHVRWEKVRREEEAKKFLIDSGFALTEDAMAECVSNNQIDIIKKFIDSGFSPSSRDKKGVPVLCIAVRNKLYDVAKYLIDIGADINAISDDRFNTPIMDAASLGEVKLVKLLIEEGANLETKSKNGQTALILAVGNGDVAISTVLLQAGADYCVKDLLGMSAKSYATLFSKPELLKYMN